MELHELTDEQLQERIKFLELLLKLALNESRKRAQS
jgi:hypothetical protein